jgi:pimeloyl-[acyl-carrier protein] methyl ester esterase
MAELQRMSGQRSSPACAQDGLCGERLYAETAGTGPPLVLLHGWGLNLRVFDGLRALLSQRHTVTALDLPGHGASPWPQDYTPERQLQLIAAQLPADATLIGWSLGGQLALQLAGRPACAVRRLVLIASTPRFVQEADWPHGLPAPRYRQFAAALERDGAATVTSFLELQVRADRCAQATLAALRRALEEHGSAQPQALQAGLALLGQMDLRALAPTVHLPTLLIAGQSDRITPSSGAHALSALLPCARLLELPRTGHAPFISGCRTVAEAIQQFLDESPSLDDSPGRDCAAHERRALGRPA